MASRRGKKRQLPVLGRSDECGPGLGRVAVACHRQALAGGRGRRVHEARRALKRLRAVLRLAEAAGVPAARAVRKRLSASARALSPMRDATVAAATRDRLMERCGLPRDISLAIATDRSADWWRKWIAMLARETAALGQLRWRPLGRRTLPTALVASARRVHQRARCAAFALEVLPVHEWRKAVIVLREQLAVLRPLLGKRWSRAHRPLARLARCLGLVMDDTVLLTALRKRESSVGTSDLRRAAERSRRKALQRAWACWPAAERALERAF